MNAITWFLLFTQVILFLETRLIYASRLCCDPDCKTPISYGKTRTRSLTGEEGRLSYPANAKVTIYSKGQRGADGVELLEAEILGRKGLLPKENVIEISTLCVPTHIVNSEVELDEANHAPSSDVDHTSSDAAPNQATLSVESNEPIFNVMPPDSGNQDNSESEEATSYDPGHGQDASHDLSYSPIIGAPTSSTTGSHDTTAPPVGSHDTTAPTTGSHDTTAPTTGSHDTTAPTTGSHDTTAPTTGSHDTTAPTTGSHDTTAPTTGSHDTTAPTTGSHDTTAPTTGSHDTTAPPVGSYGFSILPKDSHGSIPDHVIKWMEEHHTPSEDTHPYNPIHLSSQNQSHSLELTDPSTQSHSPELTDPSTHEQRHIEAVHQEDLGQDIREGYGSQNVVGLSPDPSLQEELDGTPLSLLKLYDTPIKDSPHAVPSIHYSPHAVPSVQYSPHAVPPIQYSPHVEPSVGDLAYLTPTKPGPELIISQDGHTPEGRQDGHTPEGRQDGHTPESRQDGRTPEQTRWPHTRGQTRWPHTRGRQDGHTPEGRQDNHTPDGRQDGLRYETNIPVLDSIEHITEVQSEPPLFSLSEDHHSQASSPDEQEVQSQNKYLTQVQEWFVTLQQVEIGLLSVLGTLVAMVMPLCIFWCQAIKQSTQKSGQLKAHEVSQSKLEEQLEKVKLEKDKVVEELHTAKTMCQLAENKHTKLQEERLHLESELQAMAGSHTTITQQLTLCQAQFENLKTQLAYEHSVLEAMTQEKVSAQQQLEQATTQVQQLVQRVQELEATKDQLEQDIYTSQQNLEQMQDWGSKINVEYEAVQTRCLSLESELDQANTDVAKLQTLRQCLQQVVDKEQTDGENAPLARIQAMLDTTKVQVELQKVLQEKELLTKDLQECVTTVAQLKDSCKSLEDQVLSLLRERDEAHKNHQETQMKLKGLTEYFEQKEHALHTKLGAQEVEKMAVQSKRQEAMEKASLAEQERERERVELADLRRQMAEIEKSHAQQAKICYFCLCI
ncbi:hypothetical protein EMCRGX_G032290 [Ephydatia muelleri]